MFYSSVYSSADQRKQQSSASLAFVREIHRWPANSPHKWPVTRKMFPFDDVIIEWLYTFCPDWNVALFYTAVPEDIVVRAVGSAGVSWVRVYTVLSFFVIHGPGCHRKCCHAYSFSDIFLKLGGDLLVSIPRTYFILGGCFSSSLCIMSPAMTSNYFYIPVSTFTNMDKL